MNSRQKAFCLLVFLLILSGFPFRARAQTGDYYNKAIDLFNQQDFNGAINMLQKDIESNPKNARGYELTASTYAALGNLQEAEKWFKKAVEIEPANATIYWNWGLEVADRDCGEAEQYFNKAMELKPGDERGSTGTYRTLAQCYEKRGDINKAEIYFLKTLAVSPSDESALSMIKSSPALSRKITPERIKKFHEEYLIGEEQRKKQVIIDAKKQINRNATRNKGALLLYVHKGDISYCSSFCSSCCYLFQAVVPIVSP